MKSRNILPRYQGDDAPRNIVNFPVILLIVKRSVFKPIWARCWPSLFVNGFPDCLWQKYDINTVLSVQSNIYVTLPLTHFKINTTRCYLTSMEVWWKVKERNVLFNDALDTFYLRLYGIGHMVKDHSNGERGNQLAGTWNSSMGPPWRIDPTTYRTMSERCYRGPTSRSGGKEGRLEEYLSGFEPFGLCMI